MATFPKKLGVLLYSRNMATFPKKLGVLLYNRNIATIPKKLGVLLYYLTETLQKVGVREHRWAHMSSCRFCCIPAHFMMMLIKFHNIDLKQNKGGQSCHCVSLQLSSCLHISFSVISFSFLFFFFFFFLLVFMACQDHFIHFEQRQSSRLGESRRDHMAICKKNIVFLHALTVLSKLCSNIGIPHAQI